MFIVEPVLKNEQRDIECNGLTVSFEKDIF
jgi:hypothetical protein